MTTRRHLLTLLGGAALLTACREPVTRPAAAPPAVPDLLVADTAAGLVTLRGDEITRYGPAITTADVDQVWVATPVDGGTQVSVVQLATGRRVERARLPGHWVPRAVSSRGGVLALTPAEDAASPGAADPHRGGAAGRPVARSQSTFMVIGRSEAPRKLELTGNFEPDAVTYDENGLFVLEWLPATAPDRYRVRLIEFMTTTSPQPLLTRNKVPVPAGAEEEMRGAGRQAVLHPNKRVLYTLYTHQSDHQHTRDIVAGRPSGVHAFVHVLHLEERWAYCLDLPDPFGRGPAAGHALGLSADGHRLLVADTTAGRLAVADTEELTITRLVELPGPAGAADVAVLPGVERGAVASGTQIHLVDYGDAGTATGSWPAGGEVRGLGVSADGTRLYVGHPDGIRWLDASTGAPLGFVPLPGLVALRAVR